MLIVSAFFSGCCEIPITMSLVATSGSRATVQISPFGRVLGHSLTLSDTVSPFPNAPHVGHPSMVDLKRERLNPLNIHTAASPFPGEARDNGVNLNDSPSSSSPVPPTTSTGNTDLLYYNQDGVPPAYETLSTQRQSNLPSP